MASEARSEPELPQYRAEQFARPADDCDMIMKGGVTSGIVYPYAVLEIATKYRLRSLGGTSAGAIAAAFAAAAEFARRKGDLHGFVRLQKHCDELPKILPSLFQPDPQFAPVAHRIVDPLRNHGKKGGTARIAARLALYGLVVALLGGGALWLASRDALATGIALIPLFFLGAALRLWFGYAGPIMRSLKALPGRGFGVCSGLGNSDEGKPALTEWIHAALQDIAFGDPDATRPLTFGDLTDAPEGTEKIDLSVVTTNLSMRRPHTLPQLGDSAGFIVESWKRLFPAPVMDYLLETTKRWRFGQEFGEVRLFPQPEDLPVIVAVRMSLSFPFLFSSVDLVMEDRELRSMLKTLGGKPYRRFRKVHFSDGGLSSNFPVHLFDAPLPSRPTFAISLEELLWDPAEVERRVTIPQDAGQGLGVRIKELRSVPQFGFQLIDSAKDWQDQLLSELTGQRERVARIYLAPDEGGLNLQMAPETSRQLMLYGYEAGKQFCEGGFDFDEHKWRRLVVLYDHLDRMLSSVSDRWTPGYSEWFDSYRGKVKSYKSAITVGEREQILQTIDALTEAYRDLPPEFAIPIERRDEKFPKKRGKLSIGPTY